MERRIAGQASVEIVDLPCPACGPYRQAAANRVRRVMRVWTKSDGTQAFNCIRCGATGSLKSNAKLASGNPSHATTDERQRTKLARQIWKASEPIQRTHAETYLRLARGYNGSLPSTLRYLPASGRHPHALIAAFGLTTEATDRELLAPDAPPAVHLTRLAPNGLARLDKIMIGPVSGHPIVLAPVNDGLGLTIAEGIEDALSLHEATGLGAWAAGSASHMAKLAGAVPSYVTCITLAQDDDEAGRTATNTLGAALAARSFEIRVLSLAQAS